MLALITGRGGLPGAVAQAQAVRPLVYALAGHLPDGLTPDRTFRIEHLGSMIAALKAAGVTDLCLCGAVDRPRIDPAQIDAATLPLVPVVAAAVASGEDSALRAIIGLFEQAGFTMRAAQDLAPHLIPPAGVLGLAPVPAGAEADVAVALRVLAAQGAADLGQACVIQNGTVRAREDARGTDAMLDGLGPNGLKPSNAPPLMGGGDPFSDLMDVAGDMLGGAADWLSGDGNQTAGRRGLLFKGPKPGQDMRVDMPTIGPHTAQRAVAAGLQGIVIAQGGVIVLDLPRVLDILNPAGLFLWVR
jgi:hypothetical protein